ncbi:hypothetical protein HXX76_006290 [Chlamydomonas incerta]|uniref:Uncharacterized protein n=1 Tax=Chlamydomonas incerta TaxID=51695 RepID=A0A835W5U5_CHLIN|nr:hypothetical protein HXX76_006290 [Chlamydomonas incerta]|eukprot:KAG2436766.1 hypothetical protein HXX76_006290 [Chlamydomonas incerta]
MSAGTMYAVSMLTDPRIRPMLRGEPHPTLAARLGGWVPSWLATWAMSGLTARLGRLAASGDVEGLLVRMAEQERAAVRAVPDWRARLGRVAAELARCGPRPLARELLLSLEAGGRRLPLTYLQAVAAAASAAAAAAAAAGAGAGAGAGVGIGAGREPAEPAAAACATCQSPAGGGGTSSPGGEGGGGGPDQGMMAATTEAHQARRLMTPAAQEPQLGGAGGSSSSGLSSGTRGTGPGAGDGKPHEADAEAVLPVVCVWCGTADTLTSLANVRAWAAGSPGRVRLREVAGGTHEGVFYTHGPEALRRLGEQLRQAGAGVAAGSHK